MGCNAFGLGDFKNVFFLENSRIFSLFAENKKFKYSVKCHPSTSIYLIFKNKTRIDNVCVGFWSLNLIYQFLTITYSILLSLIANLIQDPTYITKKHSKKTKK